MTRPVGAAAAALAAALVLAGCGSTSSDNAQLKGAKAVITMHGARFRPSTTTVNSGNVVAWSNNDKEVHTVKADGDAFDSGQLEPGNSFSYTTDKKGVIRFTDPHYPKMKGKIVVR